jgi:hypothetical protein
MPAETQFLALRSRIESRNVAQPIVQEESEHDEDTQKKTCCPGPRTTDHLEAC